MVNLSLSLTQCGLPEMQKPVPPEIFTSHSTVHAVVISIVAMMVNYYNVSLYGWTAV